MRLSIIIPTLNEAETVAGAIGLLEQRASGGTPEVIVADCGSTDETVPIARRVGVRVESGTHVTNRAGACNAGAAVAVGDVLLFLHADSRVPPAYDRSIGLALDRPGAVGGAFEFGLDGPQWRLRFVELVNRVRYGFGGAYFGDQGLFVHRAVFHALRGFADRPIMEDSDFCRRATRFGRMHLIRDPVTTSARRFLNGGILPVLGVDALIWMWDALGLDSGMFAETYRADNIRRGRRGDELGCPSSHTV